MATTAPGYATGADQQELLRRRNVAGQDVVSNGTPAPKEADEKPKSKPQKAPVSLLTRLDNLESILAPILFTILAFHTRIYHIGISPIVTWDEAHFGKFASHYLKREFYFDVHPPLGKMLNGLAGHLAGYNGSFDFESGKTYPPELNYTFMRIWNGAFGAMCVPLAYYAAKALQFKKPTVWLITLAVLCENSYTTISRFILLDSMLLFFTFTTVLCWANFHKYRKDPFSPEWGLWLMLTGVSIGCVCSVKWVGAFATAMVGFYTIEDLWAKFGDLKMPKTTLFAHLGFRVFGLIVIPLAVYIFCFYIHFLILENSGPGDAQMSSLFQAQLRGSEVGKDTPLEVALGSTITLKNMGYGGGLLHSHVQTYPEGSQQQQITCYHHKDTNNEWAVFPNRTREGDYDFNSTDVEHIGHGSVVRLVHTQTGRNLHSHTVAAPVTKADLEVSCYGNTTVGDTKDHWTVEVVNDAVSRDFSKLRTLTSSFRLRHTDLGCYLRAGTVSLPQWGFKQVEVTCVKANRPRDVYTHWNIETHVNPRLPNSAPGSFKSPFFRDFIHLNVAMMTSNNALVPDPDKQDDLASSFWQWPILHVGLRMCSWDDEIIKYFLLGNPLVYWGSTAALGVIVLMVAYYLVRWQRGYQDLKQPDIDHFHYAGLYPLLGWFLHYYPFFAMARVTYVHHYYPALYFAILVAAFCVEWGTSRLSKAVNLGVYGILYAGVIGLYIYFSPICFGMRGPNSQYSYMKWFDRWRVSD